MNTDKLPEEVKEAIRKRSDTHSSTMKKYLIEGAKITNDYYENMIRANAENNMLDQLNKHDMKFDIITAADYQEIFDDKQRLTKELADMLMGSDAPPAPALCDVVSFVRSELQDMKLLAAMKVISDALESDLALRESWETTMQQIFLQTSHDWTKSVHDQSMRARTRPEAFKEAAHSFISLIFSK